MIHGEYFNQLPPLVQALYLIWLGAITIGLFILLFLFLYVIYLMIFDK